MKICLIAASLWTALCLVAEHQLDRVHLGFLLKPPPSSSTFGAVR
jgi:hypothetical protein